MIPTSPEQFLEKFCRAFDPQDHHFTGAQQPEGQGSVFTIEGKILASYANRVGGPVLEIGSDLGVSSRFIMEGLDKFDQRFLEMGLGPTNDPLYCVDIHHKWGDDPSWPRRRVIHGTGSAFNGRAAWAFIDGSHMYPDVVKDIQTLARLGITRAFFHDTSPAHPAALSPSHGSDARRAILDILGCDKTWKLYDIDTKCGLVFATKRNLGDYDE